MESIGNTRLAGLSKLMIAEAANFPELVSFTTPKDCAPSQYGALRWKKVIERGRVSHILNMDHAVEIVIAPLLLAMVEASVHNFESAKS